MTDLDRLLTKDVAALAGLRVETIRSYRARGAIPPADGYLIDHPWWHRTTILAWLDGRGHRKSPPTVEARNPLLAAASLMPIPYEHEDEETWYIEEGDYHP